MKITAEWLKEKEACVSEEEMKKAEKEFNGNIHKIINYLIKNNRPNDASWLITRYMNKKQNVIYAIFAAEQVLHIFEKQYPDDDRPRKAIIATKNYLKNPCKKTKNADDDDDAYDDDAAEAAAYAADAAYNAAAYAANTAYNAYAAEAAYNAYNDAAEAAYAADAAAYAAADAAYAADELKIKIIKNGLKIINRHDNKR
jgi:hypothetical protein